VTGCELDDTWNLVTVRRPTWGLVKKLILHLKALCDHGNVPAGSKKAGNLLTS